MSIFLGPHRVMSARLVTPYQGVPYADLDLDPEFQGITPSGKLPLVIGLNAPWLGTIDPRYSGSMGARASVRLVAGNGGWDKPVRPQHFAGPLPFMGVLAATAAEALELPPVEVLPSIVPNYSRVAGPASQVFAGRTWYVNPTTGVAIVGPRIPVPANPLSVEILEWDPSTQVATIASEDILTPAMILLDARFGTATTRDIEQVFDAEGSRATCWCSPTPAPPKDGEAPSIATTIKNIAIQAIQPEYLSAHRYRVVAQAGDKLVLQAAEDLFDTVPSMLPIDVWYGVPGVTAKPLPSSECLVAFVNGDPTLPVVVGFAPSLGMPLEVSLNAIRVAIGLGTSPAAKATPNFIAWVAAITTAVNTLAPGSAILPADFVSTKLFTD